MKAKCCASKKMSNDFSNLSKLLKVISEDNRLRILCLLKGGERCVCEIYENLDISQNLASSHLRVLKNFGLINARQEWKRNYYSIDRKIFKKYNLLLTNFLKDYE
jgi:ArsR family transcriptional regulator